jgi:hypothetical protein
MSDALAQPSLGTGDVPVLCVDELGKGRPGDSEGLTHVWDAGFVQVARLLLGDDRASTSQCETNDKRVG